MEVDSGRSERDGKRERRSEREGEREKGRARESIEFNLI